MSYVTKTWKDYPDSTTALNAAGLNDWDTRISNEFTNVNSLIGGGTAAETSYSNTTSGMTATNVQAAVDEVSGKITTINSNLSDLFDGYKIKFLLSKSITFTSGVATFNTGITSYTEMRIFHVHIGVTTIISVSSISNGIATLQATKFDGAYPSCTDTVDMMVVYK